MRSDPPLADLILVLLIHFLNESQVSILLVVEGVSRSHQIAACDHSLINRSPTIRQKLLSIVII